MELVYLWVEEYKNLKNQGFNFSPRFNCDFNQGTQELKITENKDYVSIFPKNINITAIVGENGSGKTSILEFFYHFSELIPNTKKKGFIVSHNKKEDKFFIGWSQTNNENIQLFVENKKRKLEMKHYVPPFPLFYFNQTFQAYTSPHSIEKKFESINELIANSYEKLNTFQLSLFDFKPYKFQFTVKSPKENINKIINNFFSSTIERRDMYHYLNYIITIYLYHEPHSHPHPFESLKNFNNEQEVINHITKILLEEKTFPVKSFDEYKKIYLKITNFNQYLTIREFREILKLKKDFHHFHDFFKFEIFTRNDLSFNSFSDGQKTIYFIFLNILDNSIKYETKEKNQYIHLFLDEPMNSFHPEWQRKFLNELIKIPKYLEINLNIITTTHSPFILSDLPKENVIFLKDGKQVDGVSMKQTFGANIHTLLSDSFFMNDGLMGEFAKSKIEEIRNFYDEVKDVPKEDKEAYKCIYDDKQKEFQKIQEIIGEPYLQAVVKNWIQEIELILLGKSEAIDKEIERLQKLKESRKNAKN
jgi:ABC-type multidrug transport system ATPase subunit